MKKTLLLSFTIFWQVAGYNIYRAPSIDGVYVKIGTAPVAESGVMQSFNDPDGQPGMCYILRGFDSLGREGAAGNPVCMP